LISIPIAAYCNPFSWQLDLLWFCHKQVYGETARSRVLAVVIRRNDPYVEKQSSFGWNIDLPYKLCESFFDIPLARFSDIAIPLNIQAGVSQVLSDLRDDVIIEVIDCDMMHFRPSPTFQVRSDELIVSTVYEDWHLRSKDDNLFVIERYFKNNGMFYNGGFVPIIGKVGTFKKILRDWIRIHIDILRQPIDPILHWWAGMFALQAACERSHVRMRGEDCCYVPGIIKLTDRQYISHYSVDKIFNKQTFPNIDVQKFDLNNPYYRTVKKWLDTRSTQEI